MKNLKSILTSGLLTLLFCLIIAGGVLIMTDTQPVQAETADQAVVEIASEPYYLPLTDAPVRRDISQQQFATP